MSPHTDAGALRAVNSFISPEHARDDLIVMIQQRDLLVSDLKSVIENHRQAASQGGAGGEIERCAKIADAESDSWIKGEATTAVGQSFQRACHQIALKIRALSRPSTGGEAETSLQNLQTSPTEQEFLEDNIATVAFHLGQPGARLSVSHEKSGLAVGPGEVLKEVSRRLTAPAQASTDPLKALAGLFSESVHETWTTAEVVSVIEDAIRMGSAPSSASRGTEA